PHGIYPCEGEDNWVAISCRDDAEWAAMRTVIGQPWAQDACWNTLEARLANEDRLDELLAGWTRPRDRFAIADELLAAGVPATAVKLPAERVDDDPNTAAWGLWPEVGHSAIGRVRADGLPMHLSETDWRIERGGPCLGEHNELVYG